MGYVENHLSRGEAIVLKAKKNVLYLLMPLIFFVLLFILAIVGQVFLNPRTIFVETVLSTEMAEIDANLESATGAGTWGPEDEAAAVEEWNASIKDDEQADRFTVSKFSQLRSTAEKYYRYQLGKAYDEMVSTSGVPVAAEDSENIEILMRVTGALSIALWILFILVGLLPFLVRLCRFYSFTLALTNKRVVGKAGILRIHSMDYPIDKIDHVEIKAGIFGNLFKYAELSVMSVGSADMHYSKTRKMFVGIRNAQEFKDAVTEAVERHAAEARKAQAEEIARAMGGAYRGQPYGEPHYVNPPYDPSRK